MKRKEGKVSLGNEKGKVKMNESDEKWESKNERRMSLDNEKGK